MIIKFNKTCKDMIFWNYEFPNTHLIRFQIQ